MWWFVAAVAHGQDASDRFNGNLFRPSPDSPTTLWTEQSGGGADGSVSTRAYLHYAASPVRAEVEEGNVDRLVSQQLGYDVLASWRWRGLRLAAHMPLYLIAAGEDAADQPGLGDLAFDIKSTLVNEKEAPVGVALQGRLMLPTASVEVPLGATGMGWELVAIVDRTIDRLTLAGNVGTTAVPRAEIGDLVWDDGVFGRVAAGWALRDDLGGAAELSARTNWASGRNPAGTAAELLLGGYGAMRSDLVLRGGVSFGLSRSPGAPIARLVAGVSWEPDMKPDHDLDGVIGKADWCPTDPEDPDGFEDTDGCPDDAVAARFDIRDASGARVPATITLDGAETLVLEPGDPIFHAHPGDYRVTVSAPGHAPWTGDVRLPAVQGHVIEIAVDPLPGV
jgi:hypothetical protein